MMFNRVMRNSAMAVGLMLAFFTGVLGCEKDEAPAASDKGYLVDGGGSAEIPDDSDPCLAKGAAGAMGLLLKADCAKIKSAECGNYTQEDGEQCDPPDGKVCDIKCQKITPGVPGDETGTTGGAISIETQAIKNGVIGKPYASESITADGKKASDQYVWSATAISQGFELQPSGPHAVKVVSTEPTKHGNYSATVKACLKSDNSVCAEETFSFEIKDELSLKAYKYASSEMLCDDDDTSCSLTIKPEDYLFDLVKPASNYKYLLSFKVTGQDLNNKSYQWSFSYKKNNKTIKINPAPIFDLPINSGLYSQPYLDDASAHYLVFGTAAYGKTYKDVIITVTNDLGGKQELKFSEINIPSKQNIAAALQVIADTKLAEELAAQELCKVKISGIKIDNQIYVVEDNDGLLKIQIPKDALLRADETYNGELQFTDEGYTVSLQSYTILSDLDGTSFEPVNTWDASNPTINGLSVDWEAFTTQPPFQGPIEDTTMLRVKHGSDDCSEVKAVEIKRTIHLPDYGLEKISDVKLLAKFGSEYTDGDSKIKFDLLDSSGNLLATTGNQGIDGADPTCFNKYYKLNPELNKGDLSISNIASVKIGITDQTFCSWYYCEKNMKFHFKYLRLEVDDTWFAESNEPWNTNIETGWSYKNFILNNNSGNESIWFYGKKPKPDNIDDIPDQDCDEWKD